MPTRGVEFAKVSYTPEGGHLVLREVSVSLAAGSVTALLGRSGSGKTTLLRLVNALVRPTSGEVMVDGRSVGAMQALEELVRLRRGIGYAIQETGLFPHMTIERNTALSLELERRPPEEREQRSREILAQVGLDFDQIRSRLPWQLSGGQRQRVGLARALALDPAVLLMDEPFGALDPLTRAEMHAMLKRLLDRKPRTVLMVTHDLNEALFLADRILILAEGEIVADLAPAEVMRSGNPHVKDYVSAANQMMRQ
jgi:osmoprotectant transport system ATP-binding protein